jgi:hydrogenase maturation protease
MSAKILIAGIGNIFKADDGFGVEVVQRLAKKATLESARVVDFGIRGLDLAYALLDGQYEAAILVDVVKRGGPAGTVYVLEIDPKKLGGPEALGGGFEENESQTVLAETHGMHPAKVLAWVKAMGGSLPLLRLVGCEPQNVCDDEEDLQMGLTPQVEQAIDQAIEQIEALVRTLMMELEERAGEGRRCAHA